MKHLFNKSNDECHNFWMSYTDLMSGFLVVFIIASIIYYNDSNELQKICVSNNVSKEELKQWIEDNRRGTLVNINKDFKDVFKDIPGIDFVDKSGSIRVYPYKSSELFQSGKDTMECNLQERLDRFGSAFVRKAMDLSMAGKDIQEIRIEGHTDSDGDFIYNLGLSSRRAHTVYTYIHDCCNLTDNEIRFMEDKMIAVGYSEARRIDSNQKLISVGVTGEDKAKSRRIEFRIIGQDKYSKLAE